MPLKAYEEFAQEPLTFPIGGKAYVVPPLGFEDGVKLQRIIAGEDDSLEGEPAEALWRMVMGAAFDEMIADQVPFTALQRAGFAAVTDFQFGRDAAEKVWVSGLDPKALLGAMSPETPEDSTPSTATGEARRTRSRASGTGTTSPTARKRTPAKKQGSSSSS